MRGNRWKEEKWFESGRRQDQDGGRSLRRVHQVIIKEYKRVKRVGEIDGYLFGAFARALGMDVDSTNLLGGTR